MNLDDRLLRQAGQSRLALFLTLACGFTAGILTVLQAGTLSQVISRVFLGGQDLAQVLGLLQALLVFILLRSGLAWASEVAAQAAARRVKLSLREQLYQRITEGGPAFTSRESSGELASVLLEGVETLEAYYSQYLPQLGLAVLVPLTVLIFVFPLDWLSGIVLLVTAPLIPLFMALIGSLGQTLARSQWQSLSRMNAYFLDVIQGLTVLKIFGRSQGQGEVIEQVSDHYRQVTMNVLRVTFLSALVLEMVATLSTAVVAVEIGLRLLYGRLEFEQAFFVLLLAPEFYLPLRLLGMRFHAGMAGAAAAKRIFAVLEGNDVQRTPISGVRRGGEFAAGERAKAEAGQGMARPLPVIRLERVGYAYDGNAPAIQEVSFEVQPGQVTALVGPSGGGKSTIASLLLRFIEPQVGRILIDGRPLEEMELNDWWGKVAWVSQKPYLFQASVAENIRLGKENASLEEVVGAARMAQADEFIRGLAQGYDTVIGERGAGLSAGQAQRIALARAFLKDAPMLILDEASANLDPETEDYLQEALASLLVGRTTLIIAHRLNTIRSAGRILVFDRGQLVEAGSFEDLEASGGLFARMVKAYVDDEDRWPSPQPSPEGERGQRPSPQPSPEGERGQRPSPQPSPEGERGQRPSPQPSPEGKGGGAALLRLLRLVAPFKGQAVLSVLVGTATIGSGIGLMATSAFLISAAALGPSIAALQVAIVGVRFFGIARGVFRYLERYISHQVTLQVLGRLRVTFYQALEPLVPARLIDYRSGDLLARISGDIGSLENFYIRALAPPVVAVLVSSLAVSLIWAWAGSGPAVGLLVALMLAGLGTPALIVWLSRRPGSALVAQRAALSAALVDGIQGLPDLLVYGQSQRQTSRFMQAAQALAEAQRKTAWITGLQSFLVSLFSQLGMWVVLVLSIPLVANDEVEGVYLAVITLTALTCFEAVQPLPLAAQVLESSRQAARRLFEIVDARAEVFDPIEPLTSPDHFGMQVKGLSFTYPRRSAAETEASESWPEAGAVQFANPLVLPSISPARGEELVGVERELLPAAQALNDVSFELPAGKKLAVVGPSGSGKSTLVGLLLRFWEIEHGEVRLGGHTLQGYRGQDVRRWLGVVSQNTYLFQTSIRENLLVARPRASQAELEEAVELAQLGEWIEALPQGMETFVGEQGQRLSAGQRQRLAVARAVLKRAPVLILDEPTGNLDALTEQSLLQALYPLMQQCSVIYITHRLVGMAGMDEILVLSHGQVVERGRHDDLVAQDGFYRKLYTVQRQMVQFE